MKTGDPQLPLRLQSQEGRSQENSLERIRITWSEKGKPVNRVKEKG